MTREEVIRLAKEAGLLEVIDDAYQERNDWHPFVERFVELVAAEYKRDAERYRWLRTKMDNKDVSIIKMRNDPNESFDEEVDAAIDAAMEKVK